MFEKKIKKIKYLPKENVILTREKKITVENIRMLKMFYIFIIMIIFLFFFL